MDEGEPSILNRTAQFESYEIGGSGCGPFITRWTAPGEPRRTRAGASDKNTAAVSGETPATQAAAARVGASYGCAIALRTFQYHPHPRGWTRTAASRRRAEVQSTATATTKESSAIVQSSGCPSIYGLMRRYLSDAEGQGKLEQLRRRRAATVLKTMTRRRRPEPNQADRVIKTGYTPPTDAPRGRNRDGEHSPELETKNSARGRIGGTPKSSCFSRSNLKWSRR